MACNNCGKEKTITKEYITNIGNTVNRVIALDCAFCGNLMYGKVTPIK